MKIVNENFIRFDELYYGDVFRFQGQYYMCIEQPDTDKIHSNTVAINLGEAVIEPINDGSKVELIENVALVIGKEHEQ